MKFLITGGCGFLGSNLAERILKQGDELAIFDSLFRAGSYQNLEWLRSQGKFKFYQRDIRSYNDVESAIADFKPDVIFHLAGQVAMTTSILDPRLDFEINVIGGHNLLEAVRKHCPNAIVTYSSTNKVFGDFNGINFLETPTRYIAEGYENGFDESTPLNFESPYGCSKGAIDQYMQDYFRMFGIKTVVLRHSSIYGGRQFSTYDQGWIGWFVLQALQIKKNGSAHKFTISGNGKQVRDVLFSSDLVDLYFRLVRDIEVVKGQVFNIGGGVTNSLSLLELFSLLEAQLDVSLKPTELPWRASDQKVFIADIRKIHSAIDWRPLISKEQGIQRMIEWVGAQ